MEGLPLISRFGLAVFGACIGIIVLGIATLILWTAFAGFVNRTARFFAGRRRRD